MAPRGRFELPTFRLTAERSTIELPGNVLILLHSIGSFKLSWVGARVYGFQRSKRTLGMMYRGFLN